MLALVLLPWLLQASPPLAAAPVTPAAPVQLLPGALLAPSAPPAQDPAAAALAPVRSVYRVEPVRDGGLIALGLVGVAVPYTLLNDVISQRCPCDPGEVNALDRGVIGNRSHLAYLASDVTVALAVGVPAAVDLWALGLGPELVEDLVVYAQALWLNGALVALAKYTTQRPLPLTYAGDPGLIASAAGYRAFYSGHTATTVAALTTASFTIERRYGPRLWPWLVTAGVGTSIAVELVASGRHFYTDVLVGGAVGFAVGYLVPWLHAREPSEAPGQVTLVPLPGGALVGYARSF